jgi:ornithine cyclodeaminase
MVRILHDRDIGGLMDRRSAVELMQAGYQAEARGEVVPFPRSRTDAGGVTLAWMGAAIPTLDILGFRSYLHDSTGFDRGDQLVALYRYSTMELKAIFLGRQVGIRRTGASLVAALRFAEPDLRALGVVGTGTQAREVLACAASTCRLDSVWVWSPDPGHRAEFKAWATSELRMDVHLATGVPQVVQESRAIALVTSSEGPVVTPDMLRDPRLLLSVSAYRRPEIDLRLIDSSSQVWTDSVAQASGKGTLFEGSPRREKLRSLAGEADAKALRNDRSTRIIINTGAAWEEILLAESLWRAAESSDAGVRLDLPNESVAPP